MIAGLAAAAGSTAVGVSGIIFGARQARRALQQLAEVRGWERREATYVQLAEWLVSQASLEDPLTMIEHDWWESQTSAPSPELLAKIRLFGTEEIFALAFRMQAIAFGENWWADRIKAGVESGQPFGELAMSKSEGWKDQLDAQFYLFGLRTKWQAERRRLEDALKTVYQPNSPDRKRLCPSKRLCPWKRLWLWKRLGRRPTDG